MNQNEIVEALLAAARGVVVARYPEQVEPLWAGLELSLRDAAERLVAQAIQASRSASETIATGKTVDVGTVRIHRYADSFQITDLTNAGKRGKTVKVLSVSPSAPLTPRKKEWLEQAARPLLGLRSYDAVKSFAEKAARDLPDMIRLRESEKRGVDVNPAGMEKIQISTHRMKITSLPDVFVLHAQRLVERIDDPGVHFYQDTFYHQKNKKDAALFHTWLKKNRAQAEQMTLADFKRLWDDLGVRYDYH
jgi:hypothetical protein